MKVQEKWWLLGVLFFSLDSFADIVPIQERAQGHSLLGSTQLNDGLYSNPAASAFTRVYIVEGTYMAPESFGVSILDTRTSVFGGTLGYYRVDVDHSDRAQQALKLAINGRVSEVIGVGIAGKALWGDTFSGEGDSLQDIDVGVLANLESIQFGGTIRNLGGGDEGFGMEREWGLGARFNYQQMLFVSAATYSKWDYFEPYQYGFGAEYVSQQHFSIKGGFRFQPRNDKSYWSVGGSIHSPKIGIHYALEIPNQEGESLEHTLALALIL